MDCVKAARGIISTYSLPVNGKTPEERHEREFPRAPRSTL
jgi:hypothetical protein